VECRYSGIEHLSKTVALSRFDWREITLAMFTACFDASGTVHDQPYLVVAGYVSSANDWIRFDQDWQQRLRQDGLSYFHRADCESNRGEFSGWKGKERAKDKLLHDLITIVSRNTYRKVGCMISNKVLAEKLLPEVKRDFHLHAYAFAGIVSVSQVYKWAFTNKIRTPIEWIFEDGDDGKGELMANMRMYGYPYPSFRPKKDRLDNGSLIPAFTGLQAADYLAYEMFQMLKNQKVSPYLRLLHEKIGEPSLLTVKSVEEYNQFFKSIGNLDEFVARLSGNSSKAAC